MRRDAAPQQTEAEIDPYRAAERLWNPDLAAAVQRRLRILETLDNSPPPVALAATLPEPSVRVALLRTLERNWDEGPKGLKGLRIGDDLNVDPGFVVVVKMLRRKGPADLAGHRAGPLRSGNEKLSTTSAAKKAADPNKGKQTEWVERAAELKKHEEQLGQEWLDFSQEVVERLCRRLAAAAQARGDGRGGADSAAEDDELPIAVQSRSEMTAAYRLDWPDELDGKVATAPLLRIRYAHVERHAAGQSARLLSPAATRRQGTRSVARHRLDRQSQHRQGRGPRSLG